MTRNIFIILLFLAQIISAQEIDFNASVSKTKLGVNERIRVKFSVNNQGVDDFKLPSLKDFKVVSGPMMGTNFTSMNGKMSFEKSYTYTLQPKRKGILVIGAATANFNGKQLKTKPIKITVTKAVAIPKDKNDPNYIASQSIHLVAEVSNTNPYLGESITVIYKLYVDVNSLSAHNPREVASPTFNGFWNQNIEIKGVGARDIMYQGKQVKYIVIKKAVLIPQKSGKLIIEPMEMEIDASVYTNRRDFFGNRMSRSVTYTASTGKRVINVKPLPEEGKPTNFSGAVGSFDFKVIANKQILKANESAQIKVQVSGQGNLKLIDLPTIETPNGLEQYEPEHKENIRAVTGTPQGSVYNQYTVVPQFKGKYKIPSVSFSYFNLKSKKYETLISEPIVLNVTEGKEMTDATTIKPNKVDVTSIGNSLRYISNNTDLAVKTKKSDFLGSPLFYVLLGLPLLCIPIGIFIGKKKRERDSDVVGNKRRKADRLARKYLSEAKKQLGNKEAFYVALEKALHNYLKAKLQVETSDISKDRIAEILRNKTVDEGTIAEFVKVLDDCDYARYTPTSNVMMQQEYEKAKNIITKLDKQL